MPPASQKAEVSCRNLDASFHVLSERGIAWQEWLRDSPLPRAYLQRKSSWISWPTYVALIERYASLVGEGAAELTARAYIDSSDAAKFARSVAGLLVDPYWLYWLSVKISGPSVWPTVKGDVSPIAHRRFRQTVTIIEGYEDCAFFLDTTHHCMRLLPSMLGHPPAQILYRREPMQATFDITLAASRLVLPRAVHALMSLVTHRTVTPEQVAGQLDTLETCLADVSDKHHQIEALCAKLGSPTPAASAPEDSASSHLGKSHYHAEMAQLAMGTLSDLGEDYRLELQAQFDQIKAKNPRFSLRAFARKLALSPTMLSNVLSGQRNLSVDSALVVAQRLGYSTHDARRFCRVVQLSNIADPKLRSLFSQ